MNDLPCHIVFIPLVIVLLSFVESVVLWRLKDAAFDWRDAGLSLLDLLGRNFLRFLLPLSFVNSVGDFVWQHRLLTIPLDSAAAFALLFLGQEFCYYWYHRAAHRVRWFWATHAVHHSPNHLNFSAAYRLGWTGGLTGSVLFFMPLILLGFRPKVVLACLTLNLLYQFWIHATWITKLGWLEYILNTPSAHRVHHAANLEYLDANYGGVLIIFDRLFNSYRSERADVPCQYGWVKPLKSTNLLRIEFENWLSLARDMRQSNSVLQALGYLWHPPGWNPNGPGETTEELRSRVTP